MPPTIYLIDGHALAYRTYFALLRGNPAGFTTRTGEPTAGIFGFISVLLRIMENEKPEFMAVAFDTGKTFRDEIYPEYKGTRAKMPDDLRTQIERIRQLVDAFHIPRLEMEGYEADDVLGSVALQAVNEGYAVKIITGDRDLLQLVTPRVVVNLPGKSLADASDYFPEDVLSYLGVLPGQVVDYKALVGDKSDNIPGVAGIGEKTAVTLITNYQSLEGIYAHLDEQTESIRKKLISGREDAYLSQKLAAIVTDLNLNLNLEQTRLGQFDLPLIESIFRELEFRSLMKRLESVLPFFKQPSAQKDKQLSLFSDPAVDYSLLTLKEPILPSVKIIDTTPALEELIRSLSETRILAIDTETTSTDEMQADLVGISLATSGENSYYLPVGHKQGVQLPSNQVIEALRKPLSDTNLPKIGHNLKYDYIMLARNGLFINPLSFDTMIAEWVSDPNSRNLGLKNLAWVRLNMKMTPIEALIGKGKQQISMADVDVLTAAAYAAADAAASIILMPQLEQEMQSRQVIKLFIDLEMPLISVLANMEMAGISLDVDFLEKMSEELLIRIQQLEQQVYLAAEMPFNINSPQQLSDILFKQMKIAPTGSTQKTATGFYSTAAGVLESLRGSHPVVDLILEYRELSKLKSTYLDALPIQVNPYTGRIHTSYNQTGSVTGRIASSDPNLQNIPIRTELGRKVRRGFIASPGNVLLSVDYSQVELRIVAHIAGDQAMLAAFNANQDIHTATAAAIYNISLDKVTKEHRRHAKAINFGLIYGMSPFGLTRTTELTLAEAEDFVAAYFKRFPGVKSYLDGVRRQATEVGFVETLLGRRRYFPGLKNERNANTRGREEREAINAPIQGTAADIMKLAMLAVPSALVHSGLHGKMLLQVHDELVLECPKEELGEHVRVVQQRMENAYQLSIPLKTDARWGKNWDEMQSF